MSDTVIKVENLGKKYIIGHQGKAGYKTFREHIISGMQNVITKSKQMFTGQEVVDGDILEEFWALKNISFEVKGGDRLGIIGRNGAGKSTLLKILSRITEPTTGRIYIKGRVTSLLEVGTGFHPELTGRENIFLNGAILGMGQVEIRRKFNEIVEFSGVEKFLDTPVKRYSSGMYVRLAFSVAAHLEPEILIVDEVLAVGDIEFQEKCLGKMNDVSKNEGRTVLFVSHNMGALVNLCNYCMVLNNGIVESIDKAEIAIGNYYKQNKQLNHVKREKSSSDIYIKEVYTCNESGEISSTFAHKENIYVRVVIGINRYQPNQNIGIAMLNREKRRVFTVNKFLSGFQNLDKDEIVVDFIIEGGVIAPMEYSFLVALNSRYGAQYYDMVDDVCGIKIYDDGTDFAPSEGSDYGYIMLKDNWRQIG